MKKIFFIVILITLFRTLNAQESKDSVMKYYSYFFNSNPYNAEIIYLDSTLGITPLRFFSVNKLQGLLIFKKDKFREKLFNLNDYDFSKGIFIELEPILPKDGNIIFKNKQTQFNTKRNFFAIGGFGAAVLASLLGTINFKDVANKSYNNYLSTLDRNEYDKSRKYDLYSGLTFAAMEAALAGFIYFLFIDK